MEMKPKGKMKVLRTGKEQGREWKWKKHGEAENDLGNCGWCALDFVNERVLG